MSGVRRSPSLANLLTPLICEEPLIEDRPGQNTKIYAESINYTNMSNMGSLAVAMLSQAVNLYKKRSAPQL